MAIDVTVLRVFTDSEGNFGNLLGVVDAKTVEPAKRQRVATELGYSETVFIDLPQQGSRTAQAHIFTPTIELAFAGHPIVGAAWWLQHQGTPVHTLQVSAGIVQISYTDEFTLLSARSEWAPEFALHQVASIQDLQSAESDDYADESEHYVWTWVDQDHGQLQARMFAPDFGIPEDEATGAAAIRMTDYLSQDLMIIQGKGSQLYTTWNPEGWVTVAGRVVDDGMRYLS